MHVFLPPSLHEALRVAPPAPSLRRVLGGPGLATVCLGAAWGGLAAAEALGLAVGLTGDVRGWAVWGAGAATLAAGAWFLAALVAWPVRALRHHLRRRRQARTPGLDAWADAKRGLRWRDAGGALTARTHIGLYEHRLATALAEAGFQLDREPEPHRAVIVPQYELRDLGRGDRNYVADFAYLDPVNGIHVDIELDEPEHHDADRDRNRNLCFVRRGWLVIRFHEDEVVHDAASCARAVRTLIRAYEGDDLETLRRLDRSAELFGHRHPARVG